MTRVSVHHLRDDTDPVGNRSDMTCFLALGVSFIQDYKSYNKTLNDRIAHAIVESVNDYNLNLVLTDVAVNTSQYINGVQIESVSLDKIQERANVGCSKSY